MKDNIKPEHYRKGEIDLYEAFSQIFPHNEYRAGMQMIAMRYMFRDKIDRVEDLNKAMETLERLKEKEIEQSGGSVKDENDFEKISNAISNKKIKIAGFYQDKAYIRRSRLLKELQGNGYEYLVRGKHGTLLAYEVKVQKNDDNWGGWHDDYEIIENENFPEVQWTDEEPTEISELLESYENGGENGK